MRRLFIIIVDVGSNESIWLMIVDSAIDTIYPNTILYVSLSPLQRIYRQLLSVIVVSSCKKFIQDSQIVFTQLYAGLASILVINFLEVPLVVSPEVTCCYPVSFVQGNFRSSLEYASYSLETTEKPIPGSQYLVFAIKSVVSRLMCPYTLFVI